MKKFRLLTFAVFLAAMFGATAFAQTQTVSRVALINTARFYADEGGINKVAAAYKSLDAEFAADFSNLESMAAKFETLKKEVEGLQNSPTAVKREIVQAKVDELEGLERDFKFRQEDSKARYAKREASAMEPIVRDIGAAIGEYAKQKGFTLVLDAGKLYQAKVLIYIQDTTEITKDFIQFYNARPAGTASTKP